MTKTKKHLIIGISSVLAVMILLVGACGIYVSDYYAADYAVFSNFTVSSDIPKSEIREGATAYIPPNATKGFIFYPGGKVEAAAYEPLMYALADKGITCVLVEMPFHLAILDMNAADGITELLPTVEHWYIGGHSLGGCMAANYVANHIAQFDGLILLGAYSIADLSHTDLDVLSVYGSEDMVLNREKYSECLGNLPQNFTEFVIEGGCHAYFGVYGEQDGDGKPSISNQEQIAITAEKISAMIHQ